MNVTPEMRVDILGRDHAWLMNDLGLLKCRVKIGALKRTLDHGEDAKTLLIEHSLKALQVAEECLKQAKELP